MEAFPCRRAATVAVGKTLLEGIILTWGLLLELYDKSAIALEKFQMLLVKSGLQCFCCTDQPQSSGQMERTNVCVCAWLLCHVRLFVTPWTVARQAPLSMEFSRQEYWSGLPFPPPGDLPDPGTKLTSLVSFA